MSTGKREENKEVTYLSDDVERRLIEFVKHHDQLKSKSRTIEVALDFYLTMAAKYGLDDRWWPRLPKDLAHAAEPIEPYRVRGRPAHK